MKLLVILLLTALCGHSSAVAQSFSSVPGLDSNDVGVYSSLVPGRLECLPINTQVTIAFGYENNGILPQYNVPVYAVILGASNQPIYSDSLVIDTIEAGAVKEMTFKNFTTERTSENTLISIISLPNDANRRNDTLRLPIRMAVGTDGNSIAVLNPVPDTTIDEHSPFVPIGCLWNAGATDLFDIPVRVEIRSCTDHSLVFRADTSIEAMYLDSLPAGYKLPRAQNGYDVSTLSPGCYTMAVIIRISDDGDRSNDTAYSTFSIVKSSYVHDVAVTAIVGPTDLPEHGYGIPVIHVQNVGKIDESQVLVVAVIKDPLGVVVYRDSSYVPALTLGAGQNVQLSSFSPKSLGLYSINASVGLAGDQNAANNVKTVDFSVGVFENLEAISVVYPEADQLLPQSMRFNPRAQFRWTTGGKPLKAIAIREQIRKVGATQASFQADTTISPSVVDNTAFVISLPSNQVGFDTRSLSPGKYVLSIFRTSLDSNRLDDTIRRTFGIQPTHDVSAIAPIKPMAGERIALGSGQAMAFQFKNSGLYTEDQILFGVIVLDSSGTQIFRDTRQGSSFPSTSVINLSFATWTPKLLGTYTVIGFVTDALDEDPSNDSLRNQVSVALSTDVQVASMLSPLPDAAVVQGENFGISANVVSHSVATLTNVPMRVGIRRCADGIIVAQFDTVIATLEPDVTPYRVEFPTLQGTSDIRNLAPGCYKLQAYARATNDKNRMNDTGSVTFEVIADASVGSEVATTNSLRLQPNFPNPFERQTALTYTLPVDSRTQVVIRDLLGRQVYTQSTYGVSKAGEHTTIVQVPDLPDGVYVLTLTATDAIGHTLTASRTISLGHSLQR